MDEGGSGDRPTAIPGERLRAEVVADFGVDLVSVEAVQHGADEAAELWRGISSDGSAYAVKLSGGGTPAGLMVSAHLAEHGVPGVVRPVPTCDGRLWSEREGRRLSVVPWVSDDRALDGGMSTAHWTSYGALLAKVHATAVTDTLATQLLREDHTHERLAATIRALDRPPHRPVDESTGAGAPADHLAHALVEEWRSAAGRVATLLELADSLGRELRTRTAPSVVCHGDPHLGNVLIGRHQRVWLIDWDDAVLAPLERDLMFVIGGVLAFAPVTQQEQVAFFDGYGEVDLDPTRLAYYRCTRALVDLADPAALVVDVGGRTEPERANALAIVRGLLSPTGLVGLALSSARNLVLLPDDSPPTGVDAPG